MEANLDLYKYVISIDLGSTFSGSCYVSTLDKNTIIHVTKWPDQKDTSFEKTPTVCLYDKTKSPPVMIKWGKAAVDHAALFPHDGDTFLISEFKLKLFSNQSAAKDNNNTQLVSYRTAAVDYLRAIHTYTLSQFLQNNPDANADQVRYVLTIPAIWVNKDSEDLRQIAIEAGLLDNNLDETTQKARLAILSEAHAASLFCEREYCATSTTRLSKGKRYLVCDIGGWTADIATYECTENEQDHCQLAVQSGGPCGSIFLDQNMESYLRDTVFFSCADERLIKMLVEQFKTKIKHYFGEDGNEHNNFLLLDTKQSKPDDAPDTNLAAVTETKVPIEMIDCQQDDYNFDEFNESRYSDDDGIDNITWDEEDEDLYDSDTEDQKQDNDDAMDSCVDTEMQQDDEYIYLTMPSEFKQLVDPLVIENLLLREDLITSLHQIRISHKNICKHVFDPVVSKVIQLIRKQILKLHTTIDLLFLLGGFGQSPYLQKKVHEEFIASTNSVQHVIVPDKGYRSSMRGGIHFGIQCAKAIPEFFYKDRHGNHMKPLFPYHKYKTLVAIDLNFHEMKAGYSVIDLNINGSLLTREMNTLIEEKLPSKHGSVFEKKVSFDPNKFIEEYYNFLEDTLLLNQSALLSTSGNNEATHTQVQDDIYYDFFINGFMQQLFEHIQTQCSLSLQSTRYCVSIASLSTNADNTLHNNPKEKLKMRLLSKMLMSEKILDQLECPLHRAVCKILDDYSLLVSSYNIRVLKLLEGKVHKMAVLLGILEEEDSNARFSWSLNARNMFYIQKCALDNALDYESSKIFVFELSRSSSLGIQQRRGGVQVCGTRTRRELAANDEETFDQDLDFNVALMQQPETDFLTPKEILDAFYANNFSVLDLLTFLGTETDFMASEHVRNYIKRNIDLSNPKVQHSVGGFFLMPNTTTVVPMDYQKSSIQMKKAIEIVIHGLQFKSFTTESVEKLLLFPWIRRILVPVIMETYNNIYQRLLVQYSRVFPTAVRERASFFIFPDQIIETMYEGQTNKRGAYHRQTCAAYLLEKLFEEIRNITLRTALPSDIELYNDIVDTDMCRHVGCIIEGLCLPSKNNMIRIARRTYAVHFLQYFVKKSAKMTTIDDNDTVDDGQNPEPAAEDEGRSNNNKKTNYKEELNIKINIDTQDHFALHPVIRKDANLVNECQKLNYKHYFIQDQCSLAVVLYASDDIPHLDEYYTSNASFKKLNQFVIPIKDPTKPILIHGAVEDYSILFTINQGDDYKANFRYNDLMYYLQSLNIDASSKM